MPESDDPVIHLLESPVPPIETQPAGQVVYADQAKEPRRAVPTVEVRATELAERLEAISKTGQANEQPDRQQTYRLPEVRTAVCEYAYTPSSPHKPRRGPRPDDTSHMRVAEILADNPQWAQNLKETCARLADPPDGKPAPSISTAWSREYKIKSYAEVFEAIGEKEIQQHIKRVVT